MLELTPEERVVFDRTFADELTFVKVADELALCDVVDLRGTVLDSTDLRVLSVGDIGDILALISRLGQDAGLTPKEQGDLLSACRKMLPARIASPRPAAQGH